MTDLSKRLKSAATDRETVTPDESGMRVLSASLDRAKALMAEAAAALEWKPTHRHYKGSLYRVVAEGRIEADLSPVVIYDDKEGNVWVRPHDDFHGRDPDGVADRFVPLPTPPEGE